MKLHSILSKGDAIGLLEIIQASIACATEEEFRALITSAQHVIPFEQCVAINLEFEDDFSIKSSEMINVSYPDSWLEHYVASGFNKIDSVIRENFLHFRVQAWSDTYIKAPPPKAFISEAEDFGLEKGYSHGVRSKRAGLSGTIISFAGKNVEYGERSKAILEVIVPHLSVAFVNILRQRYCKQCAQLTSRELEILQWVKAGKSSWEIGQILSVSERTVNFHVGNICRKLDVSTRAQAVAVAMHSGLIDINP